MRASIVVPTYNHCSDLLKPCLESILQYTDLTDTEIIIVANGCSDETYDYLAEICVPRSNIKKLWFDEAVGYTRATNEGLKIAQGEHVVFLNNDIILINQEKNKWLDILLDPFKNPQVGITGPMMIKCPYAQREFIIFFCACIRKDLLDKYGPLDEIFSPGFCEDVDFCCKIEDAGYKMVQVGTRGAHYVEENGVKILVSEYPIYHRGHVTFKEIKEDSDNINRNGKIIAERYAPKIDKALKCDGWMTEEELRWLGKEAKKRKVIVEIGVWHGRSTRALGDNTGGVVYAIDHFNGTQDDLHASAKQDGGDHAFMEFCDNNFDLIKSGKVIPLRGSSASMAKLLKRNGVRADMIFIDAEHKYEAVKNDIERWSSLLVSGGMLCGHDIQAQEEVGRAVKGTINWFYIAPNTTIWYCEKKDIMVNDRPIIYDCFIFNDEFDMLETRMSELWDVVDRFVIVEMDKTHSNKPKPLHLRDNLDKIGKYLSKVSHIMVTDSPPNPTSWNMAQHQRMAMMRGLTHCKDDDIVIISDIDEIPTPEAIKGYNPQDGIMSFEMDFYYYNMDTKAELPWIETKILPYSLLKRLTPPGARYARQGGLNHGSIPKGGRHLSYFGGVDRIIKKIEEFADQDYNQPKFKVRRRIEKAIREGKDLYGRPNVLFTKLGGG